MLMRRLVKLTKPVWRITLRFPVFRLAMKRIDDRAWRLEQRLTQLGNSESSDPNRLYRLKPRVIKLVCQNDGQDKNEIRSKAISRDWDAKVSSVNDLDVYQAMKACFLEGVP